MPRRAPKLLVYNICSVSCNTDTEIDMSKFKFWFYWFHMCTIYYLLFRIESLVGQVGWRIFTGGGHLNESLLQLSCQSRCQRNCEPETLPVDERVHFDQKALEVNVGRILSMMLSVFNLICLGPSKIFGEREKCGDIKSQISCSRLWACWRSLPSFPSPPPPASSSSPPHTESLQPTSRCPHRSEETTALCSRTSLHSRRLCCQRRFPSFCRQSPSCPCWP